jgi:hypothetical protein
MSSVAPDTKEKATRNAERNSKAFIAMENDVADIGRMAKATVMILDLYLQEKESCADANKTVRFTEQQIVSHLEPWSEAMEFMVHHLADMARELRRHYA